MHVRTCTAVCATLNSALVLHSPLRVLLLPVASLLSLSLSLSFLYTLTAINPFVLHPRHAYIDRHS